MAIKVGRQRTPKLVYVVSDGTAIKIGVTSEDRLHLRLGALQTANPRTVRLIGTLDGGFVLEKTLHDALAEHRLSGEWFALEPALLYLFREYADRLDLR